MKKSTNLKALMVQSYRQAFDHCCLVKKQIVLMAMVFFLILTKGLFAVDPSNPPAQFQLTVEDPDNPGTNITVDLYQRSVRHANNKIWLWDTTSGYTETTAKVRTYRGSVAEHPNIIVCGALFTDGRVKLTAHDMEWGRGFRWVIDYDFSGQLPTAPAGTGFVSPSTKLPPQTPVTRQPTIGRAVQPGDGIQVLEYGIDISSASYTSWSGNIENIVANWEHQSNIYDMYMVRDCQVSVQVTGYVIRTEQFYTDPGGMSLGEIRTEWRNTSAPMLANGWDSLHGSNGHYAYGNSIGQDEGAVSAGAMYHEEGHNWDSLHSMYHYDAEEGNRPHHGPYNVDRVIEKRKESMAEGDLSPLVGNYSDPLHPQAYVDVARISVGETTDIDVLANDWDSNGDTISVVGAVAKFGAVSINGDGTLHYTPPVGFVGKDIIVYTVQDDSAYQLKSRDLVHIEIVNNDLMVHYDFDEVAGSTAVNKAGNERLNGELVDRDFSLDSVTSPVLPDQRGVRSVSNERYHRTDRNAITVGQEGNIIPGNLVYDRTVVSGSPWDTGTHQDNNAYNSSPFDRERGEHGNYCDPMDGDYTLAFWFKHDAADFTATYDVVRLATKFYNREHSLGFSLWASSDGRLSAQVRPFYQYGTPYDRTDRGVALESSASALTPQQWHHAALVIDRSGGDNVRLYLDGLLVAEDNTTLLPGQQIFMGRKPIRLGDTNGDTTYFDDLRIYTKAISAAAVQDLWQMQFSANVAFNSDPFSKSDATKFAVYSDTIAGSATDPEGDPLTYSKLGGPGWLTVAPDGSLSGVPTAGDVGPNAFTVQVSDGNGNVDAATLNITVLGAPGDPTIVDFNSSAADSASGVLTTTANLNAGTIKGTWSDLSLVGVDANKELSVGSYSGTSGDHYLHMTPGPSVNDQTFQASATLNLPSGSALEGTIFSFDMALLNAGGQLGYHTVKGVASDGKELFELIFSNGSTTYPQRGFGYIDASGSFQQLGGSGAMPNGGTSAAENSTFDLTLHAGNFDMAVGNTVLGSGNHTGLSYNSATPGADLAKIIFTAYKSKASALYDNIAITTSSGAGNTAPAFTLDPISKADASEDASYTGQTLAGSATDADGDPLVYSRVNGPGWLVVAPDGTLSGTPTNSDVGLNVFTIQATDGIAGVTATLNITVLNTNSAPTFTTASIDRPSGQEGLGYSGSIAGTATDADVGDILSYSKVSGPAWLVVASDGTLSGMPSGSDGGINVFAVQVSDGNGGTDTAMLNINVLVYGGDPSVVNFDASAVDSAPGGLTTAANLNAGTVDGVWTNLSLVGINSGRELSVGSYSGATADHYLRMDSGGNDLTFQASATLELPVPLVVEGTTVSFDMAMLNAGGQLGFHTVKGVASDGEELFELIISNGSSTYPQRGFGYVDSAGSFQELGGTGAVPMIGTTAAGNATFALTLHAGNFDMAVTNTALGAGTHTGLSYNSTTPGADLAKVVFTAQKSKASAIYDNISVTPAPAVNNDPVFAVDPFSKPSATEDAAYTGQTIAGSATDADGDSLTYSKVSGPAWLSVATNGTLSGTPENPDVGLNTFTVQVDDGNGGVTTATLNVTVMNTNDAPDANDNSASVAEGTTVGSAVLTVVASDVDAGDTLSYAITAGNTGNAFSIDNNGNITTAGALDYETTAQYVLAVTVTDSGLLTDTATVTVDVTDVNEAPGANDNSGSIAEGATIGSAVLTVAASDPDAGDVLSYTITAGNTGNAFIIDSNGTVTTAALLDHEAIAQYVLTVTVTDTSLLSDTATVTIDVNDVNEAPVASDASGSIAEDAITGSPVAAVAASDVDAGDSLIYSITGGNGDGAFTIDAGGNLTTAAPLDYETTAHYVLTVTVTDSGLLTDTATVTVDVSDVNESPEANDISGSIAEDAGIGSTVLTLTASDVDAGDVLSFAITAGNTGNAFAIDGSGNITTTTSLDYETISEYVLTVTVTDSGLLTDTATVTVDVTDVVEITAPVIATGSAGNLSQTSADIGYTVSDDGGEAPTVTIYYGTSDGGSTPGNWDSSAGQGAKATGGHSASLSGLTEGTTYYFTVHASNSAGEAWGSSGSFTTEADTSPKLVRTTVSGVGNGSWTTVNLGQSYSSAVIIATPIYPNTTTPPVVTRITNVSGSSFDLKIDRADGLTDAVTIDVSIIAVEEGVYTQATDGVTMEAVKYTSTVTADNNSWVGETQTYQNTYTAPVVAGQVMSANDANWSVFYSMGNSRTAPASASVLNVGKHVGEDPNATRANETIGYIVIESGSGTINGVAYEAALGADTVRGFGNSSSPYTYTLSGGLSSVSAAAASISGMDGNNGAWAVLSGSPAMTTSSLGLHALEDQMNDAEQSHTTTQVGYIVFE